MINYCFLPFLPFPFLPFLGCLPGLLSLTDSCCSLSSLLSFPSNSTMNLAYTGLVMNIPIKTPTTVVKAKPDNKPIPVAPLENPTYASGNIAAINVAADANMMKKALLILNLRAVIVLFVCMPFFNTSSVIII